jgi:hypothetical protein
MVRLTCRVSGLWNLTVLSHKFKFPVRCQELNMIVCVCVSLSLSLCVCVCWMSICKISLSYLIEKPCYILFIHRNVELWLQYPTSYQLYNSWMGMLLSRIFLHAKTYSHFLVKLTYIAHMWICICVLCHEDVWGSWCMEPQSHNLFFSAPVGGEWSVSRPGRFTPSKGLQIAIV